MAVAALKKEQVSRIILTDQPSRRGRLLLFAGDLQKRSRLICGRVLRALRDMLEPDEIERHMARQTIEVAPLATCGAAL